MKFSNQRQYSMVNIADGNQVFRIILFGYKYINQLEEKFIVAIATKSFYQPNSNNKNAVFCLVQLDDKDMVFLREDNYCNLSGF